ncbi:hypothetical protein E2C01_070673 [Portunus trituberculatus]|uniref:Uncharacterized protein n=1 Tax=Portunus trituberculatus TaxID=210409 RepID=A0A5B7I2R4_PORTR|nr:hypothetical protein [Portunus trituberculatus]
MKQERPPPPGLGDDPTRPWSRSQKYEYINWRFISGAPLYGCRRSEVIPITRVPPCSTKHPPLSHLYTVTICSIFSLLSCLFCSFLHYFTIASLNTAHRISTQGRLT